jgi:hypothetical protein
MDWYRDLGYQGLLVITFLGVAVAGLIYAKKIEPVLMQPVVQVQYWNYRLPHKQVEPERLLENEDVGNIRDYHRLEIPFGTLE